MVCVVCWIGTMVFGVTTTGLLTGNFYYLGLVVVVIVTVVDC